MLHTSSLSDSAGTEAVVRLSREYVSGSVHEHHEWGAGATASRALPMPDRRRTPRLDLSEHVVRFVCAATRTRPSRELWPDTALLCRLPAASHGDYVRRSPQGRTQ